MDCINNFTEDSEHAMNNKLLLSLSNKKGFTLVELIVVMGILAALVLMALPAYTRFKNNAKTASCAADLRTLEKDITAYIVDKGTLPASLNDVGRGNFNDPWGRQYNYYKILSDADPDSYKGILGVDQLNTDFDLYSTGVDGLSAKSLNQPSCNDDIIRAADGGYVGLGGEF